MSKPLPPSRTAPQFVVRFPDEEMRDRIKQAAEANNRSMNAEIVARLQQTLEEPHETPAESTLQHLQERLTSMEETLNIALQAVLARTKK